MACYSKNKERITIGTGQPDYSMVKGNRGNIIYNEQANIVGRPVLKLVNALINSNLCISFAAVFIRVAFLAKKEVLITLAPIALLSFPGILLFSIN